MKSSTIAIAASALALSLGALAAPPAGHGGGASMAGGMGGGMAGGMSSHSAATAPGTATSTGARSTHEPTQADGGGRSVDDILSNNTRLASQIHDLTGTDAQQACSGFKNLGECVSAAHVSKNLGIGFDTLKTKLTGSGSESLGKAVHELKPDANAGTEVRKAHRQSQDDLKSTSTP